MTEPSFMTGANEQGDLIQPLNLCKEDSGVDGSTKHWPLTKETTVRFLYPTDSQHCFFF